MTRFLFALLALLAASVAQAQTATMSVGTPSIATAQVSVGATATLIVSGRPGRTSVLVQNLGTTPVYVGPAGVTASSGTLLPGVVGASITIPTAGPVYGVTASGTQSVSDMEAF